MKHYSVIMCKNNIMVGSLLLLALAMVFIAFAGSAMAANNSVTRLSGEDRWETSAEVAKAAYPEGTDKIIIARGDNAGGWADGLAASFLAGVLDAPILLTAPGSLPAAVATAIEDDLKPSKAYVLGGTGAISAEVEKALSDLGLDTERIEGDNREKTAVAIANWAIDNNYLSSYNTAFIAQGRAPADSMIAGPAAFANSYPILLVNKDSVPDVTANAITNLGIENVIIVGGTAVVSEGVETELGNLAGIDTVTRLAGIDRVETSVEFANGQFPGSVDYSIVNGWSGLADAVGAAVFGNPILYVNSLPEVVGSYLEFRAAPSSLFHIFGGEEVITTSVRTMLQDIITNITATGYYKMSVNDVSGGYTVTPASYTNEKQSSLSLENNPDDMFIAEEREVKTIVIIYTNDYETYIVENVVDDAGNINIPLRRGEPAGMAFVDVEDKFMGYLDLGSGLGSIPSQYVDDETSSINLGSIEIKDDGSGDPENNPIANKDINISESDLDAIAVADSFFSAVAMNPELIESLVSGQFIGVNCMFFGSFFQLQDSNGSYSADISGQELTFRTHRMGFHFRSNPYHNYANLLLKYPVVNGEAMDAVNLEGLPEGEANEEWVSFPGVGKEANHPYNVEELTIPIAGQYRLYNEVDNDLNLTFKLPEMSEQVKSNMIIPTPEVFINENGYIEEIVINYYTASGAPIENPEKLIWRVDIQLSDKHDERIGNILVETIENGHIVDLSSEEILWENVGNIDMAYDDYYDLHYVIPFQVELQE